MNFIRNVSEREVKQLGVGNCVKYAFRFMCVLGAVDNTLLEPLYKANKGVCVCGVCV